MGRQTTVLCDQCGKSFSKPVNRANEAKKLGQRMFCSKECRTKAKTVSVPIPCHTCGKILQTYEKQRSKSKSGYVFCSHHCSALFSNKERPPVSSETKEKIRSSLRSARLEGKAKGESSITVHDPIPCAVCGVEFKPYRTRNICCSRACGYIYEFGALPLTKEEVASEIQRLHKELGHTPSTKQVAKTLIRGAERFFQSWNKAMRVLGFEPNTQYLVRKPSPCKDGHRADSHSERIVDNWLFEHGIKHDIHKRYPEGRFTCDFYLPDTDTWVEYYGLSHPAYLKNRDVKRTLATKHNLHQVEITPDMLYPEVRLTLEMFHRK
jgi:hypothetical protein